MTSPDVQALLREGIAAASAFQKQQNARNNSLIRRIKPAETAEQQRARKILLKVIELDQTNIPAWLWLSTVVNEAAEKRVCLENVLYLDPDNQPAQNGLKRLDQMQSAQTISPAVPLPPKPPQATLPQAEDATQPAVTDQTTSSPNGCPFCRQPLSLLTTICSHCHLPLTVDCPACEYRVDVEQDTCPDCGLSLGNHHTGPAYFAELAALYQRHQRSPKAIEAWQAVEQLDPNYPHLRLNLGQLQATERRAEAAIPNLRQAIDQEPDPVPALLTLGNIYQDRRRWSEAEALYRQILSTAPQASDGHFALGWLLMEQGQFKSAQSYLQKATKLDPEHGQAWLRLAQLYDQLGKKKQAARAYHQATNLLSSSSLENLRAQRRLNAIRPSTPQMMNDNWGELLRQMSGPVLICVLAALLDAGLRPWWVPLSGWLAIVLAIVGAFLWVSGSSLPRNPLIYALLGEEGSTTANLHFSLALIGAVCWLLAFGIIIYPINQPFPEIPTL